MLLCWRLHSKHIILFIINIKNIQPDISLLAPPITSKKGWIWCGANVSPLGLGSRSSASAPCTVRTEQAMPLCCEVQFSGLIDVAEMLFSDGPAWHDHLLGGRGDEAGEWIKWSVHALCWGFAMREARCGNARFVSSIALRRLFPFSA